MRLRSAVLLVLAGLLLLGHQADAAASPPLTFKDPAGDSKDLQANTDVVAVSYEVKTLKKGEPPKLIVSMTLSAKPAERAVTYTTSGDLEGCGTFATAYRPGALLQTQMGQSTADFHMFCGAPDPTGEEYTSIPIRIQVKGNTITWAVSIDSLPRDARKGGAITGISGYTETTEPVFGIIGTSLIAPTDEAVTDKEFRFV